MMRIVFFDKAAQKRELNNKNNKLDSAQRQIFNQSVTRSQVLCYSLCLAAQCVVLSRKSCGGNETSITAVCTMSKGES